VDILIIKPSSLGDVIHALPVLKALKQRYPHARVDWVISSTIRGLLDGHPMIDELISIDKDRWKDIHRIPATVNEIKVLIRRLRSRPYDMVIDLQGLLRSGIITAVARSKIKIGPARAREGAYLFYNRKVATGESMHAVDRYLEIARAAGAETEEVEFPISIHREAEQRVREKAKRDEYVLIFPSARWLTKRWPAERFASLTSGIDLPVIICGSVADRGLADKIIRMAQETGGSADIINLCGMTDLKELIALINSATLVITNDTGPMHISAALNRPTVAIFGPTSAERTGPYRWEERDDVSVISAGVECSPCRKKSHCSHLSCMIQISVDEVKTEVERLLNSC